MTILLIQSDFCGKEFHCTLHVSDYTLVCLRDCFVVFLSVSVCLLVNNHPVFLIFCLSVIACPSVCLSVNQSVCLFVHQSRCQSASL